MQEKPTLLTLRRASGLTSQEVAEAAGVSLATEYLMEIGGLSERQEVIEVLAAFSRLTGKHYTLQDVAINIRPSSDKPAQMGGYAGHGTDTTQNPTSDHTRGESGYGTPRLHRCN